MVKNEILSSAMGELPPAECQAELWVLIDGDAERAEQVSGQTPAVGPDWTCACGEKLGAAVHPVLGCGAERRLA